MMGTLRVEIWCVVLYRGSKDNAFEFSAVIREIQFPGPVFDGSKEREKMATGGVGLR